ncbi:hypothetical protein B5G37_05305 [Pseudoflavonifractor sp. An85]|nr:hypothetical protein B5G37_05305 [Pseudoflavonifractor sp. An85]
MNLNVAYEPQPWGAAEEQEVRTVKVNMAPALFAPFQFYQKHTGRTLCRYAFAYQIERCRR